MVKVVLNNSVMFLTIIIFLAVIIYAFQMIK